MYACPAVLSAMQHVPCADPGKTLRSSLSCLSVDVSSSMTTSIEPTSSITEYWTGLNTTLATRRDGQNETDSYMYNGYNPAS